MVSQLGAKPIHSSCTTSRMHAVRPSAEKGKMEEMYTQLITTSHDVTWTGRHCRDTGRKREKLVAVPLASILFSAPLIHLSTYSLHHALRSWNNWETWGQNQICGTCLIPVPTTDVLMPLNLSYIPAKLERLNFQSGFQNSDTSTGCHILRTSLLHISLSLPQILFKPNKS